MPKKSLIAQAAIATTLAFSAASHAHDINPFEAETYQQCVGLGVVGIPDNIGVLTEVRRACREVFPVLPSLRDPDTEVVIYCSSNLDDEFKIRVTPTTFHGFEITRRDDDTIKASAPDWDHFSSNESLLEIHPDLKPGMTANLDINTGKLKTQSTSVDEVYLEHQCREW